ncbi:unnamed protein product [Paramecium sonneborni]|uniref:Uncharacterized protein n=1 Tax=Paramecium sonneborni TaxID=65129 RepID=A0A8S1MVE8_9CILI|nr:unnamed protein product [Paramecium sonneborni]
MRNIEDSALRLFNHIDDLERQGQVELCSSFIFAVHLFSLLTFFNHIERIFMKKKINIKVFVESYLFDIPPENICNKPTTLSETDAPKIGQLEWKKIQQLEKYENLEKETRNKIRAAISEFDFKQYKNAQQQILTAIDLLNNLLQ